MSQEYAVGQHAGDYEILAVLGSGGMGKVYKVRNTISDRIEAMKVLLPDLAGQKELAERFLREIKVLASLNHPNIAALRTALMLDDQLVMIMEFVDGVTLASRLQRGPLPPAEAVNYADQVLAALGYAHKMNIVHRDIKPANMMLTPQGAVKLMDFGIARSGEDRSLTMTGTTLGSLNYMPPEQINGQPADARSDIYSLGVSLYEMMTGQLPFKGDSQYSLMAAHLKETPKPPIVLQPGIPETLNEIVLMAMSKEPEKRFQSADAFRAALKSVVMPVSAATEFTMAPVVTPPSAAAAAPPAPAAPPARVPTVLEPAPATAAAAAEAMPPPPPPAQTGRFQRSIYMALGALLVVGVLTAAGFYLPRRIKTRADADKPAASPAAPSQPANPPAETAPSNPTLTSQPVQPGNPGAEPAADTPAAPQTTQQGDKSGTSPVAPAVSSQAPDRPAQPGATSVPAAPPTPASASPARPQSAPQTAADAEKLEKIRQAQAQAEAEARARAEAAAALEEAENHRDQLNARAEAVGQSLDNLRRRQSAQGFGLRGDVVAAQQRMEANLANANRALKSQDPGKAKKYLDAAERDLEFLEKFLGR